MKLIIDLQEGFKNDTVEIFIGQNRIYHKENLTTKMQVGLADHIEQALQYPDPALLVRLPQKNISETLTIPVGDTVYIGISLSGDNKINFKLKKEPFFYM